MNVKKRPSFVQIKSRAVNFSFLCVSAFVLNGCALVSSIESPKGSARSWMSGGVVAVSRPVPEIASRSTKENSAFSSHVSDPVLGFMPSRHTQSGSWVKIDRARKTITLFDGSSEVTSLTGDGLQGIKPGIYSIAHKQNSPLWYAPDLYFSDRALNVPSSSSSDRYRRGALGSAALFIDADTPIHTGPVWRD